MIPLDIEFDAIGGGDGFYHVSSVVNHLSVRKDEVGERYDKLAYFAIFGIDGISKHFYSICCNQLLCPVLDKIPWPAFHLCVYLANVYAHHSNASCDDAAYEPHRHEH